MARDFSKMKAGYLPLERKHWEMVRSLIAANKGAKTLDPFAGMVDPDNGGHFHSWLSHSLSMEGFANELSAERAETLSDVYDIYHLVCGPAERLEMPLNSISLLYANPPYDHDTGGVKGRKRVELAHLEGTWKYLQPGGVFMWVVYKSHLTDEAIAFIASRADEAKVFGLPGKHQGQYDQIIVVGTKTTAKTQDKTRIEALAMKIEAQRENMPTLSVLSEPLFTVPAARKVDHWYFTSEQMDREKIMRLLDKSWHALSMSKFQRHLTPPPVFQTQKSVHPPRPGHMALVLGSGLVDGAIIDTVEYGRVIMRATKRRVETMAKQTIAETDNATITTTIMRENTKVTITLMQQDGTIIELFGDELVLPFVAANADAINTVIHERFDPIYKFDFGDYREQLNAVRLGNQGQYQLYLAQKHMIAAILEGFKHMQGILVSAQMGTGKTSMGGGVAYIGAAAALAHDLESRGDVTVVVAPPHLMPKWKEELGWQGKGYIKQVNNMKDLRVALKKIETLPRSTPKFLVVKRDLAKLGGGFTPAVAIKPFWFPLQPVEGFVNVFERAFIEQPDGTLHQPPMSYIAVCPTCGNKGIGKEGAYVKDYEVHEKDGYLISARRECGVCGTALWQEKRNEKKAGDGVNEDHRMRIDQAIKHHLKGRVRLVILDEAHEGANPESGVGEAYLRLSTIAARTLALTGTPMNGKAGSLYNLAFMLNPRTREEFPRGGSVRKNKKIPGELTAHNPKLKTSRQLVWQLENPDFTGTAKNLFSNSRENWTDVMGVREYTETFTEERDERTGALTGTTSNKVSEPKEAPGVTTTLIGHFMPFTAFMNLLDLGKWLPKFTEVTEAVPMDHAVAEAYQQTYENVQQWIKNNAFEKGMGKEVASMRARFLEWSMGWPNAPFRSFEFKTSYGFQVAIGKGLPETFITNKEKRLIEFVQQELAEGRKCIIYVRQSKSNDIQPRIANLLKQHIAGVSPYILYSKVDPERRGALIKQKVEEEGVNVLISHPGLVKTGLDLIQFATIVVYEMVFELSTLMQATRRCYRLNQEQPECKVLYLYYAGGENWRLTVPTQEHKAVTLMSQKQRAIKQLLGELGMTGFDALSGGDDDLNLETMLMEAMAGIEADIQTEDANAKRVAAQDATFWTANPWLEEVEGFAAATIEANAFMEAVPVITPAPSLETLELALDLVQKALARVRAAKAPRPVLVESFGGGRPTQIRLML